MKNDTIAGKVIIGTLIAGIVAIVIGVIVAANRSLSWLEAGLLQVVQLSLASYCAYIVGKEEFKKSQKNLVSQRATMALRRVLRQLNSLVSLANTVEKQRTHLKSQANSKSYVAFASVDNSLDIINDQLTSSWGVSEDMIADWKEIAPDEAKKIEQVIEDKK